MPVTLAMRCVFTLLLFLLFTTGCNPGSGGADAREPIDRMGNLIFTRHAKCRMDCRHITAKEIREILTGGTINYDKSDPGARPDPKYAVEGYTVEKQHLRIIVAPEGKNLIVITCIELGVEWTCHCN